MKIDFFFILSHSIPFMCVLFGISIWLVDAAASVQRMVQKSQHRHQKFSSQSKWHPKMVIEKNSSKVGLLRRLLERVHMASK